MGASPLGEKGRSSGSSATRRPRAPRAPCGLSSIGGGKGRMLRYLRMEGVGPAPEMGLDIAPRLNLLTGDNGLGKTFILDVAWWALTRTWAGPPAWPQRGPGKKPRIAY